jgi:hypothetical protein
LALAIVTLISSIVCKAQFDPGLVPINSTWHNMHDVPDTQERVDQIERSVPSNSTIWISRFRDGWAWTTNAEDLWLGAWKQTRGMRVQLSTTINATNYTVSVQAGNFQSKIDTRSRWFTTPNGKFWKFELLNLDGIVVQPKPNAGKNLLKWISRDDIIYCGTNLPAWALPSAGTLIADFPEKVSTNIWPTDRRGIGFASHIQMSTRGNPQKINSFNLYDLYSITNEGDYMLKLQPVLYMQKSPDGEFLDRVDLPSVTTKVHLIPNGE